MGCLLSRRRQGDGGMETAVPLLPRKQEKCWTLKKWLIPTRLCLYLLCVCVWQNEVLLFHIHENRHFQVWKTEPKHPGGLSLSDLFWLSFLSHSEKSEMFSYQLDSHQKWSAQDRSTQLRRNIISPWLNLKFKPAETKTDHCSCLIFDFMTQLQVHETCFYL